MSREQAYRRVVRILDNLQRQHYGITDALVNVSPVSSPYADILTDPDVSIYYGDLRSYEGSTYRTITWSSAADMLTDDPTDEWNTPAIILPVCSYSDYSGSTVERANYNVMIDDSNRKYATSDDDYSFNYVRPHLRPVYGGHGTTAIVLPLVFLTDPAYGGPWIPELYSILSGLADYPVLDDDEQSNLETELISEAIDSYGLFDIARTAVDNVRSILAPTNDAVADIFGSVVDDIADRLDESLSDTDPAYRAWFCDRLYSGNEYPHCEDAVGSVAWAGADDSAATDIAAAWVATGMLPWVATVSA